MAALTARIVCTCRENIHKRSHANPDPAHLSIRMNREDPHARKAYLHTRTFSWLRPDQATQTAHLPTTSSLELTVPIPQHPSIKLSNLHCRASHHDKVRLALRNPVIEIQKPKTVANLMQQDMDVVRVEVVKDVI